MRKRAFAGCVGVLVVAILGAAWASPASARSGAAAGAKATAAVPLIVDTDLFSDADDVGALATAFALQLKGEAKVIAIGLNTRTSRPAVATNSWKCAAAVAQFYGAGNVPIGSDMPDNGTAVNTIDFIRPCAQLASPSTPAPDTAVNVFRRALVGQPDGSVVIAEAGYSENLSNLLNSPPDSISSLSGRALIAQKVKTLVIMAGGYPSRSGENNLIGNPAAAQNVAANWPTKIVWSGYEVGDAVHTGNTISTTHPANSPVRVAYEAFVGPKNWIYSYDLTAVYHAVRPGDSLLKEVGPGKNVVNSNGSNTFTSGSGNQYYLKLGNATSLDSSIETLLDTLPSPTADVTPPVIGGVSVASVSSSGAVVSWSTDEGSDSQVEYGLSAPGYGSSSVLASALTVSHSVSLSGLAAGTTYHYRVKSRDAAGNLATSADFTFTTASSSGGGSGSGPSDSFDSNSLDPSVWVASSGGSSVVAANQELEITHPAGGWTKGMLSSVAAFDATGRSVQVQVVRAANNGLGGSTYGETSVYLWLDSSHYAEFFIASGCLTAFVNGGSGEVNLTPGWPKYSAATMQWLRFREASGTLYFEYASGATAPGAWSVLASVADPFALTGVKFQVVAGANTSAADTAKFDNVSTVSNSQPADVTPPVIGGVSVSSVSSSGAVVSWSTDEGSDSQVEYGLSAPGYGSSSVLASALTVSHSVSLSGLAAGTTYHYRVKSRDAAGNLATSADFTFTTAQAADVTPPVIGGVSVASVSSSGAVVSWSTDEGSDSQVEYGLSAPGYGSSSVLASALTVSHSVSLSGLAAGTTYHYRVKSRDAAGNLATSADFTFTTASSSGGGSGSGPSDSFDSNSLDPSVWVASSGGSSVVAANQELEITHPAGGWTKGMLSSVAAFDATGRSVQVQVVRAANNGLGGSTYGETSVYLWLDSSHYAEFFIASGCLTAFVNGGSGEVNLTPGWPKYSAATMQWLRFREASGTLYFEYASGATAPGAWSVLASVADPFALTGVKFQVVAGANTSAADTAKFDNVSTY